MQATDMATCSICLAYIAIALLFFVVSWLELDSRINAQPYRYVLVLGATLFWPIVIAAILVSVLYSRLFKAARLLKTGLL